MTGAEIEAARKDPLIREEMMLERARISFWHFCQLMFPNLYKDEYVYLRDMCDRTQRFFEQDKKRFLILSAPPRHKKSITMQCLTAWLLGHGEDNTPRRFPKVMTGSYNERISSVFARTVRNMIQTEKVGENIVYSDIFPKTKVKYGEASAAMWSLEGSSEVNYLATSPSGTVTGFGADEAILIDDIIKNAEEAYNENVLEDHWSWFNNTLLSRMEGKAKIVLIMTRWARGDLAGRVLDNFPDGCENIAYKAVQDDGTMLCDDILTRADFNLKTREMNPDIVEANYNQTPIDIKGRLYEPFMEWERAPAGEVHNQTDTADRGKDFLASVNYVVSDGDVFVTDIVYTDEPMETTEIKVAEMLNEDNVRRSRIESNNGGRGFARNVDRILRNDLQNSRVIIETPPQTKNKESRILASSGWIQRHLFMPPNWAKKWPQAANEVLRYQRKGVNAHDDLCDVLAAIYEQVTTDTNPTIITDADLHFRRRRSPFTR